MITTLLSTDKRQRQRWQRRLRTLFAPTHSINLSSTDYLNLSSHPYIKEQAIAYGIQFGTGSLPTRKLSSYEEALKKSEERFASLLGHETVTFYESTPHLFSSLDAPNDTESFAVLGPKGFGLSAQKEEIELLTGSFSKSFGSYVSYIACSRKQKEKLFEQFPTLHREQYIPPLFLGMVDATIQLIPSLDAERKRLFTLRHHLYTALTKLGFVLTDTKEPFISLTHNLKAHLMEQNAIVHDKLYLNLSLTEKQLTSLFASYKEPILVEAL